MIKFHGINYLANKEQQTTTEIIAAAHNIQHIQSFEKCEILIIFDKLKKRLILIKDENKAKAEANQLDQIQFFLKTNLNITRWEKFVIEIETNLMNKTPKNL